MPDTNIRFMENGGHRNSGKTSVTHTHAYTSGCLKAGCMAWPGGPLLLHCLQNSICSMTWHSSDRPSCSLGGGGSFLTHRPDQRHRHTHRVYEKDRWRWRVPQPPAHVLAQAAVKVAIKCFISFRLRLGSEVEMKGKWMSGRLRGELTFTVIGPHRPSEVCFQVGDFVEVCVISK